MTSRRWRLMLGSTLGLLVAGCGRPPELISMTPPGITADTRPEAAKKSESRAVGEGGGGDAQAALPAGVQPISDIVLLEETAPGEIKKSAEGIEYQTLKTGTGEPALPGRIVQVHYVGTLDDGTEFDNSRKSKRPFEFKIGNRQVIEGWDRGVAGMKVGEIRKLRIPSNLGYGPKGMGGVIPPDSRLTFEIELLAVLEAAAVAPVTPAVD